MRFLLALTFFFNPRHNRTDASTPLPTFSSTPSPGLHPPNYRLRHALPVLRLACRVLPRVVLSSAVLLTAGHWCYISSTAYDAADDAPLLLNITDDTLHRVFPDYNPGLSSTEVLPIRAYAAMGDACVEDWIVHHRWSAECQRADLSAGLTIDGVWSWVNGSDPAQVASRRAYKPGTPLKMDANHRYSEHNELLYSMRSFLKSVGPSVLARLHIMAGSYPLGNASVGPGTAMVGQIPAWLSKEAATRTDEGPIILHHG